jgi:hypothetical protein
MFRLEPSRALVTLALAGTLCLLPTKVWTSSTDAQWDTVAGIDRRASLTFVDRNRNCLGGKIGQVDNRTVTVVQRNAPETTLERMNVLRISSGDWAGGVVFSGRSSWSDVVRIVGRRFHPDIAVAMKSGEEYKGRLLSASDTVLTVESSKKKTIINKSDVSTVGYIRPKPLSESAEYANEELAWMKVFDPQLWPRLLHLQSSMSIRLYDASLPQEDSSIVCKPGPDLTHPAF